MWTRVAPLEVLVIGAKIEKLFVIDNANLKLSKNPNRLPTRLENYGSRPLNGVPIKVAGTVNSGIEFTSIQWPSLNRNRNNSGPCFI